MTRTITQFLSGIACLLCQAGYGQEKATTDSVWPEITHETRPWTRWWWHGSAVTKVDITRELESFRAAGIGGVEITPIYGVAGREKEFITYLSPQWVEMLVYTLREAQRLGLGVDVATGTGWPFGGPWVKEEHASRNLVLRHFIVRNGKEVPLQIECSQQPFIRAVGYNLLSDTSQRRVTAMSDIKYPLNDNRNLQELAVDQVRFPKRIPLVALVAFDQAGKFIDLTNRVSASGKLDWKYPGGVWKLIAVFSGWHGKMVERAAPGGEGYVIDHFSKDALKAYLKYFDAALKQNDISSLRAFFNDSYEVDDASGNADWTQDFFDAFQKRRGYDLRQHLLKFIEMKDDDETRRIMCDYRETLSSLLLENFTLEWKEWAHKHGAVVRNQAHGSPANILDLYATVDIPEIEGTEPLRIKMATSAANVAGKKLVSAEAVTWLNEHFESRLRDMKVALDRFMLNGVNHLFYHGTAFSPKDEPWPGWLFYAAVHVNDRNPLWRDLPALNEYVSRCQTLLQHSNPDNDVLVYYPFHDALSTIGTETIVHFDGIGKQFEGTSFARCSETLQQQGYAFDFVSDRQLATLKAIENQVETGASRYRAIVIPYVKYMPVETLEKLRQLVTQGVPVIFFEGMPESFSGFSEREAKTASFSRIVGELRTIAGATKSQPDQAGMQVLIGKDIESLLNSAGVKAEFMTRLGLNYLRKQQADGSKIYFISNPTNKVIRGQIPLNTNMQFVEILDPMTGRSGSGNVRNVSGQTEVYLELLPEQTLFVRTANAKHGGQVFVFEGDTGKPMSIDGPWELRYISGGAEPFPSRKLTSLQSWTDFGEPFLYFSGTARYSTTFQKPDAKSMMWKLDLGEVAETASVEINGRHIGTCIGPVYTLMFSDSLLDATNVLEVTVTNSMTNRIILLDKQRVLWKKFYNINFPARKSENSASGLFNAAAWEPRPSGLIGPVSLTPLEPR